MSKLPTSDPSEFARRRAERTADSVKQLDDLMTDLLREQSARLLGEAWLEDGLELYACDGNETVSDADLMMVQVWLLFHYCSPATDGRPFAEWWAERKRLRREPARLRLVEAHVRAPLGVWEVQRVERGRGSLLRDRLGGEEVFVFDRKSAEVLRPGMAVCAFVVQVEGIAFIGGVHGQPLLPSDAERVVAAARRMARTRRKAVPLELRTDPEFQVALLAAWRTVAEEANQPAPPPELRNTDGHRMEPHTDEFTITTSAAEVVERLAGIPGAQPPEREGRRTVVVVTASRRDVGGLPGDTVLAELVVTGRRLRVETNSAERADAMRAAVEAAAGACLTFRVRATEDLTSRMAEAGAMPSAASFTPLDDPDTLPPELLAQLQLFAEEHTATWPDTALPALDGLTPREAAKDRRMKARLVLLLKDMEARDAMLPQANPLALDVPRLRKELGL